MPNGIDKNYYRLCAAINAFHERYGHFPTKIRVFERSFEFLFTPESYTKLQEKLTIIYEESPFIAEDDEGNQHNYGKEGGPKKFAGSLASDWLGVEPDSKMVIDYYNTDPLKKKGGE